MKYPDDFINKVIQGDCLEVMKQMPDKCVDLVVTDPPYGIDFQSARRIERLRKDKIANDDKPFTDFLPEAIRVLKDGGAMLCFTRYDTEQEFRTAIRGGGMTDKAQVIWDKVVHGMGDLTGDFAPCHENIIFATKGRYIFPSTRPISIIRVQRVSPEALNHPNEKPVALLTSLIQSLARETDIIFDPFLGSGTTAVAAKQLGRKFIGIELSEKYCKIAEERLRQEILL